MSELRSHWFFECTLQEARKETAKSTNEAEEEKDAAEAAAAKKEKDAAKAAVVPNLPPYALSMFARANPERPYLSQPL